MDKATAIKQRAQAHIQRNSLKEAMAEYEKLLALEPVDPYAYILLGDLAVRMSTRDIALKRYGQAVDAYEAQGLCRNAIAVLKKIQRLDSTQVETLRRLADLYAREGLMAESMSHYLEFGSKCLEAGRDEETRQVLEIVSQLGTANIKVARRIADLCVAIGDRERAAIELERMAGELDGRGQADRAAELRARAAELAPTVAAGTEISLAPADEMPEGELSIPDEPIQIPQLEARVSEAGDSPATGGQEISEAAPSPGDVMPGLERSGGLFQPVDTPPASFLDQTFSMPRDKEEGEEGEEEVGEVGAEVMEAEAAGAEMAEQEEPETIEPEMPASAEEAQESTAAGIEGADEAVAEDEADEAVAEEGADEAIAEDEADEAVAEEEADEADPEEDPLDAQIRAWASDVAAHLEAGDRSAAEAVLDEAASQCTAAGRNTAARRFLLELWTLGRREIPVAEKLREIAKASSDTSAEARWMAEIGEIQLSRGELSAAQATFEWALELDPTESLARRRYERIQKMESGAAGDETSFEAEAELAGAEPIQGEPIIEAEPIAEAEVAPVGEQDSDDEPVVAGEPLIEMELLASDDEAEVVEIDRVEPGSGAGESPIPEMLIESAGDLTGDLRGGAALDGVSGLTGARGNGHGDEKKATEPPPNPATDDQLAWVIGRFQRDVSSQLGAGDHASHYDLGMAYMEMELYHEAISEFRQALGGATYRRRCLELLATCYSRAGEPQQAASHWRAALDEALKTGEGPLALRYELAVSLAAAGQVETAREELREVVRRDPKFLDANERLQALGA